MISLLVAAARTKSRLNDVKFVQQALLAFFFDKKTRLFAFSSELLNRDESTLRLDPRHSLLLKCLLSLPYRSALSPCNFVKLRQEMAGGLELVRINRATLITRRQAVIVLSIITNLLQLTFRRCKGSLLGIGCVCQFPGSGRSLCRLCGGCG